MHCTLQLSYLRVLFPVATQISAAFSTHTASSLIKQSFLDFRRFFTKNENEGFCSQVRLRYVGYWKTPKSALRVFAPQGLGIGKKLTLHLK